MVLLRSHQSTDRITLKSRFLEPVTTAQRQYEALRAFIVEGLPAREAARRFGYSPGSFRILVHRFRQEADRPFFLPDLRQIHARQQNSARHQQIITLRKQNLSIYDIRSALAQEGQKLSHAAIDHILKQEGFARLPRRRHQDRPAAARPIPAEVADVRQLDLSPRSFRTGFGGLFLFLPDLIACHLDQILQRSGFPGSRMVPAGCAIRSLLALKLFGNARHSHIMSHVLDEGLGFFAGLCAIPKRSFLTEYSCRIHPDAHRQLMARWLDAVRQQGLRHGDSFDLDFHTIPFHGQDALVEKHYVSKRSRRQKGVLAFLAQDAHTRVFCYADADLRKDQQNDAILDFLAFWKKRTGQLPKELIFDSRLTTYANLHRLNKQGIGFITLRRRTNALLNQIATHPPSAWRRLELENLARLYRTPRILDTTVNLPDYHGPIRQIAITELGHEQPTLLLTNQLRRSPATLIGRYAQRMIIENSIEDGIDFFHMDALSSAVAMKVDVDLQLTLMASGLYHLLAARLGHGYEHAKARRLFNDVVDASAMVTISHQFIDVRFQKRAHNPLLLAAGFQQTDLPVPWLADKRLRLQFG
jgi:transposase